MLCQSMMGLSDEDIIADYHQSEINYKNKNKNNSTSSSSSSSKPSLPRPGKLDRQIFRAAPKSAMEATLTNLRAKYGSVYPGYLNHIGFDESWQRRFQECIVQRKRRNQDEKQTSATTTPVTNRSRL